MKPRFALIINGLCALVLGWLYGGDALDSLRAQSAEVSAYLEPPSLVFALGALLATAAAAGATVLGVTQKKAPQWRGFRLTPIVTVVVLFVDLFVFSASSSPLNSFDRTALIVQTLTESASQAASEAAVPQTPRELQELADKLGPPPYLVKGVPATGWSVAVRLNCTGPVTEVKGEPLGTIFYCVAADAKTAWVSAVTLPLGTWFGAPALFTRGGEPVVGVVTARAPDEPEPAPEAPPSTETWLETGDGGR